MSFSGGKASAYEWFVNGVQQLSTSVKYKPLTTTNYYVELKDYCSNDATKNLSLTVNPLPVVDFTMPVKEACLPAKANFVNLSTGGSTYEWSFGNGDKSNLFEPLYFYSLAGTYDISLKVISAEGCVNSLTKPSFFKVVEHPKAAYSVNPDMPDYLNPKASFSNQSKDFDAFEWDFGDNTKDGINSSPIHQYGDTGYYRTRLIVSNYLGCKDTAEKVVRVKDIYRLFIPTAISQNGDFVNDSFVVKGRGILYYELKIYNRWGEKVYEGNNDSKPFDGKDPKGKALIKGTYIIDLKVRDFEGMMHYERQVLEIL
jgi:PKD repeat protein